MFLLHLSLLLLATSLPWQVVDAQCNFTTRDVLGPFFEEGAPTANVLAPEAELNPDTRILVQGTVRDSQCRSLPGVTVDVWHAGGETG